MGAKGFLAVGARGLLAAVGGVGASSLFSICLASTLPSEVMPFGDPLSALVVWMMIPFYGSLVGAVIGLLICIRTSRIMMGTFLGSLCGGVAMVLIIARPAIDLARQYNSLPEHQEMGSREDDPGLTVLIATSPELSEKQAETLANYYEEHRLSYRLRWPLTIEFFCEEVFHFHFRDNFSRQEDLHGSDLSMDEYYSFMLYEYQKPGPDSPSSVSTPAQPSWPTQGQACK